MNKIIAEYYGFEFELELTEKSDSDYIGFLKWDDEKRDRFSEIENLNEEKNSWYLDKDGNRLEENELFAKSPWTISENGIMRKVVVRFLDYKSGEVRFALCPWFRIGDFI